MHVGISFPLVTHRSRTEWNGSIMGSLRAGTDTQKQIHNTADLKNIKLAPNCERKSDKIR
jgi:hypothetical protein